MSNQLEIFNRKRKKLQFERAARKFCRSEFLFNEVADRIAEQFGNIIIKKFDRVLIIGTKNSYLKQQLQSNPYIGEIFETDFAFNFLKNSDGDLKINCDEEFLPFQDNSFDLVLSNLNLHWVNDLVGTLIQIKKILKNNGFFLASFFGSKTLFELRHSLVLSEGENLSPRISPFIDVKEGAGLIQRAGFKEPVSASENIDIKYENLYELLFDLRNLGETNALKKLNNKFTGKFFFSEVENIYFENFADENNQINAKFEIISLSGWK